MNGRTLLMACMLAMSVSGMASADEAPLPTAACDRISEDAARRIAWTHGLIHIEEVVLIGGRWEVSGRDREGFENTLDIRICTGEVVR